MSLIGACAFEHAHQSIIISRLCYLALVVKACLSGGVFLKFQHSQGWHAWAMSVQHFIRIEEYGAFHYILQFRWSSIMRFLPRIFHTYCRSSDKPKQAPRNWLADNLPGWLPKNLPNLQPFWVVLSAPGQPDKKRLLTVQDFFRYTEEEGLPPLQRNIDSCRLVAPFTDSKGGFTSV